MRTIWKYEFDVEDHVIIDMPEGATILPFVHATAPEQLVVWAEVDPTRPQKPVVLQVIGTGNRLADDTGFYLGSAIAGPFVWHLYETRTTTGERLP